MEHVNHDDVLNPHGLVDHLAKCTTVYGNTVALYNVEKKHRGADCYQKQSIINEQPNDSVLDYVV